MSEEHDTHDHAEGGHGAKPRPDDAPPQNGLIFFYTVLTVLSLIGLKFAMDSFLDSSRRAVQGAHIEDSVGSRHLEERREEAREALSSGTMPIDQAITQLAERGRGAFPQVRPSASEDRGAREGWARRGPAAAPITPESDEATGGR